MEYKKVKSASKYVVPRGPHLRKLVLQTIDTIGKVVGGTLGPGGLPVLIERFEHDLPPFLTKDGITVFQALGFPDSIAHCVMEVTRDAASKTATEAGDGTTTATILAADLVRRTFAFCDARPHYSPQAAVRAIATAMANIVEPTIKGLALRADLDTDEGEKLLQAVARISANGDDELAVAVLEAFRICGDDGNVTLLEATGPTKCSTEEIQGYPIPQGYEGSCGPFVTKFLSEPAAARTRLEKPLFLLCFGRLTDPAFVLKIINRLGEEWVGGSAPRNYVLCATGFSEQVLSLLAVNFAHPETCKVLPLLAPETFVPNSQLNFLQDLAAVTNATIYDAMGKHLDTFTFEGLGAVAEEVDGQIVFRARLKEFEMTRYRSTVFGRDEDQEQEILYRIEELRAVLDGSESELDRRLIQERIAKLSGGVARLKIFGMTNGETKERRDRAEDAVCAVRGAIKDGFLPGGCWTLLRLSQQLADIGGPVGEILAPALRAPSQVLMANAGYSAEETQDILGKVWASAAKDDPKDAVVFDLLQDHHVLAADAGLYDSLPAVLGAIRNSISIATTLGTMGAAIVHPRDAHLERDEAQATSTWQREAEYVDNYVDQKA